MFSTLFTVIVTVAGDRVDVAAETSWDVDVTGGSVVPMIATSFCADASGRRHASTRAPAARISCTMVCVSWERQRQCRKLR